VQGLVEIASDRPQQLEPARAEQRAEGALELVERADRVPDQRLAAARQAQHDPAAVARVGLAAQVAEALELARGRADRLAAHALEARDLVDPPAVGSDQRQHGSVGHLEALVAAGERRLHELAHQAHADRRQHADRTPGPREQRGVRVGRELEAPVERRERGREAAVAAGADERGVLRLALEDQPDALLDERAATRREPHELRAPVVRVRRALEVAGVFDEVRQLAARLVADRELAGDRAERAALVPEQREEGPEARPQAAVAVVLAQRLEHVRLEVARDADQVAREVVAMALPGAARGASLGPAACGGVGTHGRSIGGRGHPFNPI
jgi:hypothetical protein